MCAQAVHDSMCVHWSLAAAKQMFESMIKRLHAGCWLDDVKWLIYVLIMFCPAFYGVVNMYLTLVLHNPCV